jgi:hypothetical protein
MPGGRLASPEHRADLIAVALLVSAIAVLAIKWAPNVVWTPDALFYQARVLEIRGASKEESLSEVWDGPLAAPLRAEYAQWPPGASPLDDPRWIPRTAENYERRSFVPLLAAAVYPVFGVNSLEAVTVVGSLAFALLLYALLRTRFSPLSALIGVVACLAWPALRWAFLPLTDGWGLAWVTLSLLAAVLFLDRGSYRWLVLWGIAILAMGFTRDVSPVPIVGAAAVLLAIRSRRAVYLTISGILAALPAPLIFGASLRWTMAYGFSGNRIPDDSSWGFVFSHYLPSLRDGTRQSIEYVFSSDPAYLDAPLYPFTALLLLGLIVLFVVTAHEEDPFLPLLRGAFFGSLVVIAILPTFQGLRFEYSWLPISAAGIAIAVDGIRRWVAGGRERPLPQDPDGRAPIERPAGLGGGHVGSAIRE